MVNPFKTKDFKKLFAEWNKKLIDSGFDEIEDFSNEEVRLKSWHSHKWILGTAPERRIEAESYYEKAQELLNNGFEFSCDLDLRIWQLHCQGLSIRQIAEIIDIQLIGYKGKRRNNIHYRLKKIQKAGRIK